MKVKKNANKKVITVLSFILILAITVGIILKITKRQTNEIETLAESSELTIGGEDILYVDLTKKSDTYNQVVENKSEYTENKEESLQKLDENLIDKINNNYFDIDIDLASGNVVADKKQMSISDFLGIANEEVNDMVETEDKLHSYLNENIIGDIKYEENQIKIENPYSTKTIMIEATNIQNIESVGNAESIVKVANDIYCINYNSAYDTKEGYNILKEDNNVKNVCKDEKISLLDNEEDDEKIESLQVTGNNYAWGTVKNGLIYYLKKLNYMQNANEVKVAVLDTGIYAEHEVFKNQTTSDRLDTTYSYNYVDKNTDISDESGHGTKVAGIIAESTSNNVKIVPVKIMGENEGNLSDVFMALAYIKEKVDIINLSLGLEEISKEGEDTFEQVLKEIYEDGKFVVCAAGNKGKEGLYYPARSDYTIAVSATDYYEDLKSTTSIASYSNYDDKIDFSAPGTGMYLPSNKEAMGYETGLNGTSFATPFITSSFALLKSENPTYTTSQLKEALIQNCIDLGESGKDKYFGYGYVDFADTMFSKPVIEVVDNTTETEKKIFAYAVCSNYITNYAWKETAEEPSDSDWNIPSSAAKFVEVWKSVTRNGKYYIWFKDENGNTVNKMIEIKSLGESADPETNTVNNTTTNTVNNTTTNTTNTVNNTTTNTTNTVNNTTTNTTNTVSNTTTNTTNTVNNTTTNTTNTVNNTTTNTTNTVNNTTTNTTNTVNNTTTNTTNTVNNTTNTVNNTTNTVNNTTTNMVENTTQNELPTNTVDDEQENNTEKTSTNTVENKLTNETINTTKGKAENTGNKTTTVVKTNSDNSTASKILPHTGSKDIIILAIVLVLITGIFTFVRYRKLKEVK